jgi:hypothetical protein
LRDRLVSAGTWSEDYYKNVCKAALGRLLKALLPQGVVHLGDVALALEEKDAWEMVKEWAAEDEQRAFQGDLDDWSEFLRVTSGLRANLAEFVSLGERLCTAHADIDFAEAHERQRQVHFELNSQKRPEASRALARLVLGDLMYLSGALSERPESERQLKSVYVDEASQAVDQGFDALISQSRSARMGILLATQSPLNFGPIDEGVGLMVIQNTATKLVFRQLEPNSVQACAEMAGTEEDVKLTRQMLDGGLLPASATGVQSERETQKYICHPNTLKRLKTGEAALIQDEVRVVIKVLRTAPPPEVPFEPAQKKWSAEEKKAFGRDRPALDLKARLKAWRAERARKEPPPRVE